MRQIPTKQLKACFIFVIIIILNLWDISFALFIKVLDFSMIAIVDLDQKNPVDASSSQINEAEAADRSKGLDSSEKSKLYESPISKKIVDSNQVPQEVFACHQLESSNSKQEEKNYSSISNSEQKSQPPISSKIPSQEGQLSPTESYYYQKSISSGAEVISQIRDYLLQEALNPSTDDSSHNSIRSPQENGQDRVFYARKARQFQPVRYDPERDPDKQKVEVLGDLITELESGSEEQKLRRIDVVDRQIRRVTSSSSWEFSKIAYEPQIKRLLDAFKSVSKSELIKKRIQGMVGYLKFLLGQRGSRRQTKDQENEQILSNSRLSNIYKCELFEAECLEQDESFDKQLIKKQMNIQHKCCQPHLGRQISQPSAAIKTEEGKQKIADL